MLAFIVGCASSRMLCATAVRLRTVVCVCRFRFFLSYLVLSAYDPSPPLLYTYTQQRILTPSVISSLSREGLPRVTRMNPSPSSASGTYLSQKKIQPPFCLIRVHVIGYICIEKYLPVGIGIGNKTSTDISLQSNFIVAKTESVLDGGVTLLLCSADRILYQCRQVPCFSLPCSPVQVRLNVRTLLDQLASHRFLETCRLFCFLTQKKKKNCPPHPVSVLSSVS